MLSACMTKQDTGERYFFSNSSCPCLTFRGINNELLYFFVVKSDQLNQTPQWENTQENPPLPVNKAISIANEQLKSIIGDTENWEMDEIVLNPPRGKFNRWFYLVSFKEKPSTSIFAGVLPFFQIPVLMDGATIAPVIMTRDEFRAKGLIIK